MTVSSEAGGADGWLGTSASNTEIKVLLILPISLVAINFILKKCPVNVGSVKTS